MRNLLTVLNFFCAVVNVILFATNLEAGSYGMAAISATISCINFYAAGLMLREQTVDK